MEVQLADAGLVVQEGVLGGQQVLVRLVLSVGLQGTENERSHHQVQHHPHQQGQEGGAPHLPPVDPPSSPALSGPGVRVQRLGPAGFVRQDMESSWP